MTSTEEDGVRPYGRMADSLEEAWNDLNVQLEGRRILLDTSVAFHHSVEQVCIVVLARLPLIFYQNWLARPVQSSGGFHY